MTQSHHAASTLLLGSRGMLGRAMAQALTQQNQPFHTLDRLAFDLSQPQDTLKQLFVQHCASVGRPDMIINCAAYTDVDSAETHGATATHINGHAVGVLAEQCAALGITLVHFSTDYVFNGAQKKAYRTHHPIDPINAYGRSKALGETLIRASNTSHLIVRTSWLYAPWGKNFVQTIAQLAREKDSLRVVDDQRGRPTSVTHLAHTTLRLLAHLAHTHTHIQDTVHITDGGACTWFEFATEIVQTIASHHRIPCKVIPCTSDAYPRPAPRPAYSVLDLTHTETQLGPMPLWQDNLQSVLHTLTAAW